MRTSQADNAQESIQPKVAYPFLSICHKYFRTYYGAYQLKKSAGAKPCRITIGASGVNDRDWIPTEIEYLNLLKEEHWRTYFSEGSIDAILAEHVWEHLTLEEGMSAAGICYKFLKPEGYLRLAVPDGLHPDSEYIERVRPGGSGLGSDDHKVLFTYQTVSRLFRQVGFDIILYEYFDEDGSFYCKDWDTRKGMIRRSRKFDERNSIQRIKYTSIILDAFKR